MIAMEDMLGDCLTTYLSTQLASHFLPVLPKSIHVPSTTEWVSHFTSLSLETSQGILATAVVD